MKITYTAPNRSHHYPYADALHHAGHLYAFVSGFSRFSPRSDLPSVNGKLKRHDFFQNLYLASLKFNTPALVTAAFNRLSNYRLDQASYSWAKESDVFMYYRTQGYYTAQRLRREGAPTLCVLEEVNSHIDIQNALMQEELDRLGSKGSLDKSPDYALRIKAYEEADCILCPSEFVRRSFLAKGFTPERLIKVNFGFPPADPAASRLAKPDRETFRVLYVGQIHYRKGLHYAVEAFRQVKHPKKEFVIVGPKTSLTGLENTQLPTEVVFTGPLKGDALIAQYQQASVFILPSLEEGLALVQGEALGYGTPLLITTNTGGDDLITDGVEGFIVPPANAEALAQRLQQMADDHDLLDHMAEQALLASQKLGSWSTAVTHLVEELTNGLAHKEIIHKSVHQPM